MAYVFNSHGVMYSIPENAPLPDGSRWATDDEVREWETADQIRAAAGIPAPKSPQQAQLEHEALLENIAKRGGLMTSQEKVNLDTTAQQMAGAPETVGPQADLRPVEATPAQVGRLVGRGAEAGNQYTQYEPMPGVAKVVAEEEPQRAVPRTQVVNRDMPDTLVSPEPTAAPARYDTEAERAKNSPTAKSKEK